MANPLTRAVNLSTLYEEDGGNISPLLMEEGRGGGVSIKLLQK